jgi:hypothetical protein
MKHLQAMYPSDDSHDLYIREKQLMLAGTAMWLAQQAADKAKGREVQDDILHHVMSCHYADLLLQQFIDYRQFTEGKMNEMYLANAKLRVDSEQMHYEIQRLQGIIEDNL